MTSASTWVTPFIKQCFVTTGVSLNMAGHGLIIGLPAVLIPQLKSTESTIPIDDSSGSWIAAVTGIALIPGNFTVPFIMAKFGRRTAKLMSIIIVIVGWISITTATNVPLLLVGRCLQGFSMGMSSALGSILIGEYTSPKYRGLFLATISLAISGGVLTIHAVGSFLNWNMTTLFCAILALVDLVIVFYSPESPSWLAVQGRYEESRRAFRWLRGDSEELELQRLIETNMILRETQNNTKIVRSFAKRLKINVRYFSKTIKKREFYKPILIMIHLYMIILWSGIIQLAAYARELVHNIVGIDANVPLTIIILDIQRMISNVGALFVIQKFKRRTMLFSLITINIFALLGVAVFTHCKSSGIIGENPYIGQALLHLVMFSIATGSVPIPYTIAGELFPLQYRSLASAISVIPYSLNLFTAMKTLPFFLETIQIYGTFYLCAGAVCYSLIFVGLLLPETKDRTLQEIEDDFRGRPLTQEMKELKSTEKDEH